MLYKSWTSLLQASSQVHELNPILSKNAIYLYQDSKLSHMLVECREARNTHDVKGMATLCRIEAGRHTSEVGLLNTSKVTCGALELYLFVSLLLNFNFPYVVPNLSNSIATNCVRKEEKYQNIAKETSLSCLSRFQKGSLASRSESFMSQLCITGVLIISIL